MKKKMLRAYYKLTCKHDFYMDKQITSIKCCKCGYKNWLPNDNVCNLFPSEYTENITAIEKILKSKTLFDNDTKNRNN